eukprot:1501620-Prorocentrum_lima.AAC.1
MTSSLVGSEMCIRDRSCGARCSRMASFPHAALESAKCLVADCVPGASVTCLLYTSDAADDM